MAHGHNTRNKDNLGQDKGDGDVGVGLGIQAGLTFEQQQQILRMQQDLARESREQHQQQLRLVEAQLELAKEQARLGVGGAGGGGGGGVGGGARAPQFSVKDAINTLPQFDDRDIDLYLSNFEKIATSQGWPAAQWSNILTPLLKGSKALRAFNRLTVAQLSDYELLKRALLAEFSLIPEVYRSRFRTSTKRSNDSYADFSQFLQSQFDRWIAGVDASDDINVLKQVILIEQFTSKLPDDIKQKVADNECKTLNDCAKVADEFVALHRTARFQQSKVQQSNSNSKVNVKNDSQYHNGGNNYSNSRPQQQLQNKDFNTKICYYCHKPGHLIKDCPTKPAGNDHGGFKNVKAVCAREIEVGDGCDIVCDPFGKYLRSVNLYASDSSCITVQGYRDSGAEVTLLLEGAVPDKYLKLTGKMVQLEFANGSRDEVPLAKVSMTSMGVCGQVQVGLVPRSYKFPNNVDLLLGNNSDALCKSVKVVTRSQTRLLRQQVTNDVSEEGVVSDTTLGTAPDVSSAPVSAEDADVSSVNSSTTETATPEFDVGECLQGLFEPTSLCNIEKLVDLQRNDSTITHLYDLVQSQSNVDAKTICVYSIHSNGLLIRKFLGGKSDNKLGSSSCVQIIVPYSLRGKILHLAHSVMASGHFGVGRTRKRILMYFHWPGVMKDVQRFCRSCDVCQRLGKCSKLQKVPMVLPPIVEKPFSRVSIDIVGPLNTTTKGNRYVLTIVDHATHWPEAYPLPDRSSATVAKAFSDFISRFGIPEAVLNDLGTEFKSELFQILLSFYGVSQLNCSVAHPQTNSVAERSHRVMKAMMTVFCDQCKSSDWDDALGHLLFAYREVPISEYGFSPYEMLFGRHVRGPLSIAFDSWWEAGEHEASPHVIDYMTDLRDNIQVALETVHQKQAEAQVKNKLYYDRKAREVTYQPGDSVLVLQTQPGKPLSLHLTGPHKVIKQVSPVDYVVSFPGSRKSERVLHANLLRKYVERTEFVEPVPVGVVSCVADFDNNDDELCPSLLDTPVICDLDKLVLQKLNHLSPDQAVQLQVLVCSFADVFSDKPGCAADFVHHIRLKPGVQPVKVRGYRMSPQQQEKLRVEINQLMTDGLIELSTSEWSSPAILVPKPGGAVRCCIDYRAVNVLILDDNFPMNRIDDIIERIGRSKFMTKFDLSKGFHQIPLSDESRAITSFSTPFGQYQWLRLPFGLKTSPNNFNSCVSAVLKGLESFSGAYVDDVCIFSDTFQEHVEHVHAVLSRFRQAGMTIRLAKCSFAVDKVDYCGHEVSLGTISPRQLKVQALLDAPRPATKRQLQSFLGFANYYQRYMSRYSDMAAPLTALMRKGQKFEWNNDAEQSFQGIKQQLTSSPTLLIADFNKPFVLYVDASKVAAGAALMQADDSGMHRPVCYYSKKFNSAQCNYCTSEREALSLVLAVRAFRIYLSGHVVVYTDHEPLKFINRMAGIQQKILRWSLELQPYNLEIKHVPGCLNVVADYLSRIYVMSDVCGVGC
jgi:hypothetical protein